MQTPSNTSPRRPLPRLSLPHPAAPRPAPGVHLCASGSVRPGALGTCPECLTLGTIELARRLRRSLEHPHVDTLATAPAVAALAPHVRAAASVRPLSGNGGAA